MKNSILTTLFFIIGINLIFADNNKDIDSTKKEIEGIKFSMNIDSMLNLWHVKYSLSNETSYLNTEDTSIIEGSEYNELPRFSDSIYIEKLNNISSLVSLPYNEKVRAFIEAYTLKHRKRVEIMLGLTEYYFPMFEEILDSYDMPLELKYLAVIESALNPNAVSRAGATGLWQFMYTTGKMYKLNVNTFVDDRRDPLKSTHAAAQFLRDLHKIYDDWLLAIAAYNCGPGNVNKAVKRSKGKDNYWEIYHYLPKETRGYVPAYIAAVYVMNYYQDFNLNPKKINIPLSVDTIMINEDLHFGQVSEVLNLPIDLIRDLNPQYRKDIIPAKLDAYPLRLPVEYSTKFIELSDSIFTYNDSIFFVQKTAVIPPKNGSSAYNHAEVSIDGKTAVHYKVRSGDNLGAIASKYGVTVNQLRSWNNIHRNLIKVGQRLVIYIPDDKKTSSTKSEANTNTASADTSKSNISESDEFIYYKVKSGDSIWGIAQQFPGVSNTDIMELNNITNAKYVKPGQVLKIKKK